jgi:hypothetical protein
MDAGNHAMTDAELDREIEAALAVDPSPQFVARVRSEAARQPVAARVPWSWAIASAGAVVVAIAVTSGIRDEEVAGLKPSLTQASSPAQLATRTEVPTPTEVATPSEASSPTKMAAPTAISAPANTIEPATRTAPEIPDVIVDPDAVQAFEQLVISARERRFEASFDNLLRTWVMTELSVPPIIIEPLEPPAANN